MKTRKKQLLVGGGIVLAAAITFGSVVWGGLVTVAGIDPHYAPVEWALKTTMRSSVRHHASDVTVPADVDLQDPELAERAFGHYSVACTPCHGAPGVEAAPWLVLNPPAEPLVETADRWSDAELYWIVKYGIKMTGMPALGPTHGEDDLWAISAFVRQLPAMSPTEYAEMAQRHAAHVGHDSMAPVAVADETSSPSTEVIDRVETVETVETSAESGAAEAAELPAPATRGRSRRRVRPPRMPEASPGAPHHHRHGASHG